MSTRKIVSSIILDYLPMANSATAEEMADKIIAALNRHEKGAVTQGSPGFRTTGSALTQPQAASSF